MAVIQVQIGTHSFTFDHVYGSTGSPSIAMYEECVAPLVDGLFQGYNATVLAYGQVKLKKLQEISVVQKTAVKSQCGSQMMCTYLKEMSF